MTGYLHWSGFADPGLIDLARDTALKQRERFVATTVTTGDTSFRRSKVLWDQEYPDLYSRFCTRLRQFLPHLRSIAEVADDMNIELQLTAHNDGDYFRRHSDNGDPITAHRMLTYVYYFTLEDGPPKFEGGELALESAENKLYVIKPVHNSIIFFPAHWQHEVRLISVPSKRWEDGRLTLNGWIGKKP